MCCSEYFFGMEKKSFRGRSAQLGRCIWFLVKSDQELKSYHLTNLFNVFIKFFFIFTIFLFHKHKQFPICVCVFCIALGT